MTTPPPPNKRYYLYNLLQTDKFTLKKDLVAQLFPKLDEIIKNYKNKKLPYDEFIASIKTNTPVILEELKKISIYEKEYKPIYRPLYMIIDRQGIKFTFNQSASNVLAEIFLSENKLTPVNKQNYNLIMGIKTDIEPIVEEDMEVEQHVPTGDEKMMEPGLIPMPDFEDTETLAGPYTIKTWSDSGMSEMLQEIFEPEKSNSGANITFQKIKDFRELLRTRPNMIMALQNKLLDAYAASEITRDQFMGYNEQLVNLRKEKDLVGDNEKSVFRTPRRVFPKQKRNKLTAIKS